MVCSFKLLQTQLCDCTPHLKIKYYLRLAFGQFIIFDHSVFLYSLGCLRGLERGSMAYRIVLIPGCQWSNQEQSILIQNQSKYFLHYHLSNQNATATSKHKMKKNEKSDREEREQRVSKGKREYKQLRVEKLSKSVNPFQEASRF